MGNSTYSREWKAKRELDKAWERLLKNSNISNEILEIWAKEGTKLEELISQEYYDNATRAKLFSAANAIANVISDIRSNKNKGSILIGAIVDGGILKLATIGPLGVAFFFIDAMDLADKLHGGDGIFNLRDRIQGLYERLRGTTSDLPDLEMLKKGILKITMHDGTVYERPLVDIAGSYMLTGNSKDDVLFGSKGNDMLIGHGGADLLIGGSGKDDYFVDNGDTIKDSDGKGRVFLSSTNIQLTGGTQIEKGSKIYKGKDGTKYELKGSDLIINDSITIENFNPYADEYLGITLYEADEIAISVSNASAKEKEQSMSFTISLSRNLKENEFIKVTIPKIGNNEAKTYMFLHGSSTDWKVGDGIEYIFDSSTTYTYSWSDLEFTNLNLLVA